MFGFLHTQLTWTASGAVTDQGALLREDGFYVLREDSGLIILEFTEVTNSNNLLREDGFYVLREDSGYIDLEGELTAPLAAVLDTDGEPLLDTDGEFILEV
jgi:hypothetical protein